MNASGMRRVFVSVVAFSMSMLLASAGPLEALARAQAQQRAARAATRAALAHLDDAVDAEPLPPSATHKVLPRTTSAAPTAAAVLPIPLRPLSARWLSPAEGHGDPWVVFDGRESTGLQASASEPVRIGVALDDATELSGLSLLGPAEGTLSVVAEDETGLGRPIEGLTEVEIRARAGE
jgi:hypothetical protein